MTVSSSDNTDVETPFTTTPESRPHVEPTATLLGVPGESHTENTEDSGWMTIDTAHVEVSQTSLDAPNHPPIPTSRPNFNITISVPVTVRTQVSRTSLDIPGQPSIITLQPTFDGTVTKSAHTEKTQTSLVFPSAHTEITATSLGLPRTEKTQNSLEVPGQTRTTAPKAITEKTGLTLVVPVAKPTNANQPGTAVRVETSGNNDARPTRGDDNGRPNSDNQQPPSNVGQNNGGVDRPQGQNEKPQPVGGVGGLISAIQSVAAQQGGGSQRPPSQQQNAPNRPIAVITTGSPDQLPAASVTGFIIGSQTASPGGAPVTRGGSTFSALPSGSGLQVVANGQIRTIHSGVSPVITAAQGQGSDGSYVMGVDTLTAGGAALTKDGSAFSALPGGSGVQVAANGRTEIVPVALSTGLLPVRLGDFEGEYVFGDSTLTAGGQALTRDGTTFSALPSGSGIVAISNGHTRTLSAAGSMITSDVQPGNHEGQYVIDGRTLTAGGAALTISGTTYSALPSDSGIAVIVDGKTSAASIGQTLDINTADSDSDSPTPVLLPADKEQMITLGGRTYTAHMTDGSLLVLGAHTMTPGVTTVIDGKTLVLSGTNIMQAAGPTTLTTGLGDAIMSGIGRQTGGGNNEGSASSTSTSSGAESTSDAGQRPKSDMHIMIAGLLSFMFALVWI